MLMRSIFGRPLAVVADSSGAGACCGARSSTQLPTPSLLVSMTTCPPRSTTSLIRISPLSSGSSAISASISLRLAICGMSLQAALRKLTCWAVSRGDSENEASMLPAITRSRPVAAFMRCCTRSR